MPETKNIEIDEIVTAQESASDDYSAPNRKSSKSADTPFQSPSDNTFADFEKSLPWKARLTLSLTRWFMFLNTRPWGKLIIVLCVVLAILLAIPVGLIGVTFLIMRTLLRSFSRQ